jgi:7,8-dihydroneopterin aldolase/epimerase/oxygenase
MNGNICIRDLEVSCIIGCCPEEREKKRAVFLNLEIETDISLAALSDDISNALNYQEISEKVIEFVSQSSFYLLEKLAYEVGEFVLSLYSEVDAILVTVDKPGAVKKTRSVGVSVFLTNLSEDFLDDV